MKMSFDSIVILFVAVFLFAFFAPPIFWLHFIYGTGFWEGLGVFCLIGASQVAFVPFCFFLFGRWLS